MPFVEKTLSSVTAQAYSHIEYIVVDGGSTDGTIDAIKRHEAGISKWISEPDEGISDAFNKGLSLATGDYIMFLNADDELAHASVMDEMSRQIDEHEYPALIYGDCNVLDRNTGEIRYRTNIDFVPGLFHQGRQMLPHPCMLAHRSYFEKYGSFNKQYRIAMDYEWMLRGALKERVVHVPVLVSNVRDGGVSAINREPAVNEIISALKDNGQLSGIGSELRVRLYFMLRRLLRVLLQAFGLYKLFAEFRNHADRVWTVMDLMKFLIKQTPLYHPLRKWLIRKNQIKEVEAWEKNGKPAPSPHLVKQRVLEAYAHKYNLSVLVETGTYYGDMIDRLKRNFEKIYSIELSQQLYGLAKKRFRKDAHIKIVQGDSGVELAKLIPTLEKPALFWLDAHYSSGVTARAEKDTPILDELAHIFKASEKGHVVIIDDARCFGADPAYPTMDELKQFVKHHRPHAEILVESDSIRITPY